MPGLLGGIARTAVVAGTATAVSNRVSRRQANRWARNDQAAYGYAQPEYAAPAPPPPPAAPPPPPPSAADNMLDQLRQLGELHDSGVLTDEEFAVQKARILGT
jgi:hypothetical protein